MVAHKVDFYVIVIEFNSQSKKKHAGQIFKKKKKLTFW